MKKASEYRQHAQECRRLVSGMAAGLRDQLSQIAVNWDRLAADRSALVQRHPELALPDRIEDEARAQPSSIGGPQPPKGTD